MKMDKSQVVVYFGVDVKFDRFGKANPHDVIRYMLHEQVICGWKYKEGQSRYMVEDYGNMSFMANVDMCADEITTKLMLGYIDIIYSDYDLTTKDVETYDLSQESFNKIFADTKYALEDAFQEQYNKKHKIK